jgi:type IV secretion system protein VirD4
MQFLLIIAAWLAIFYWISSVRRRRAARHRTAGEIRHTLETGLPTPESALGRKAQQVAEAQNLKLVNPPPVHGTARWGTAADAAMLIDPPAKTRNRTLILGELMLGEDGTGLPLHAAYPGHLLTVAGTGQGKSATQIVANLRRYQGSTVVLDPKGELFDLTATERARFGPVYRLAPFARPGEMKSDCYNPLDELGDARERAARARHLAEMLIVRQGDKGASEAAFFENEAINLLTLIILGTVEMAEIAAEPTKATLAEVRRVCSLPLLGDRPERDPRVTEYFEDVLLLFTELGQSTLVRQQGMAFSGRERKLLSSFLSEINSNLAFFDGHPGFAEVTETSDFLFRDLADANRGATTVYLTVPLKEMHISFRFLRAMIGCAFAALEEQRDAEDASVLFILDEFPALRDMTFMRDAVAQMRSSGAWFWFFVQDVTQLEAVYDRWASVFLSQTDHQIFFGATLDARTKKHISTALGVMTYPYRDPNVTWAHSIGLNDNDSATPVHLGGFGEGRNIGQSVNITEPVMLAPRPLLAPFEVGTFLSAREPGETHPSATIIFSKQAGGFPLRARRCHWRAETPPLRLISSPLSQTIGDCP